MSSEASPEARLLAAALYELRLMLGPRPQDPDPGVRDASMLAYRLHNHALGVLEGDPPTASTMLGSLRPEERERLQFHLASSDFQRGLRRGTEALSEDGPGLQSAVSDLKRVRQLVESNPAMGDWFERSIVSEWNRGLVAWEMLAHLVHVFRWQRVEEQVTRDLAEAISGQDLRATAVLQSVLDAYSDDWPDADLLPEFHCRESR